MAFCFVQGTVGHFSAPRTPHTAVAHVAHTAAVKTKMKNSTLAAKTIFYPLAWPSFTLRPPVQSIPAIIVSLSSMFIYIYTHDDVMRPKTSPRLFSFFFSFILFFFFASLKNRSDEI